MKKIIKVFFCILTCLIISIPQIYAEESKTKELSEAVEEKKDENVEESLDKGKKEVTEEPVEQSVLETIEKPAEVTSNGTTELPKTESTSETEEKPDEEPKKEPSICYTTHIQDIGWQNQVKDGEMAGTEGQAKRLEAIKIELLTNIKNLKLKYRVHIQDIGWQDWKDSEEMAGTEGQSKRLEAIQIKLENTQDYSIEYRVHVQDIGWQDWVKDGKTSGTEGQSKRLEAIQIRIISKENDSDLQEEPKFERQEGTYGKTGLNVADKGGSELKYLKYGTGKNVFFATFAIHGYEDKWDKDGYELIEIANNFYNKLLEDKDYDLAKKWTIYIFPGVNQDGLQEGSTNNGPGRTTLYSQAPQNKGIDLNRCWQIGSTYEKFTSDRNYNGDIGFQAYEAQALRDFMLKNKSKDGQTILVDLHGWTQQLIGDENICSYYEQQFPENNKRSVGRYGSGYMISWGRTYLGSQGKPAKTALIELPRDGVKNHQSVIDKDFSNRYIYATMKMLEKII